VPAGEGDGNVKNILLQLEEDGFQGFLSLEPHLSEFEGLKTLEKNAAKRELTDGETAYTIAYQALVKILKE
jgi:sugar phosphate isomerase/epimerase